MVIVHQTDIHQKDRIRVLNCARSRILPKHVDPSYGTRPSREEFPEKVDLRKEWWDIGNQGDTGSCVGWAIADSLLRWHFVEAGRLPKEKHLSARFLWMAAKETDDDTKEPTTFIENAITKIEAGLKIAKEFGIVDDDTLPFSPAVMYRGKSADFYSNASKFKIAEYKSLIGPNQEDLLDSNLVCKWLAENTEKGGGPIVVRMGADPAFVNAKKNTSVLERFDAWAAASVDDHCAAIVGYYNEEGKMFFVLRNSWGQEWGDDGHAYLSKEYLEAAVQEAWHVSI
jgi:C1A family cysteine protease